ncbi:MAG: hypothetical protein MJ070_06700 [Lachnospiraceae bacterium]|nr:hypothetical protein [Lachnospiraceae bacterium]
MCGRGRLPDLPLLRNRKLLYGGKKLPVSVDLRKADTVEFWFYVSDLRFFDCIQSLGVGQIELTSSGVNDKEETTWSSDLGQHIVGTPQTGWNLVRLDLNKPLTTPEKADLSRVNYFRCYFFVSPAAKGITIAFDMLYAHDSAFPTPEPQKAHVAEPVPFNPSKLPELSFGYVTAGGTKTVRAFKGSYDWKDTDGKYYRGGPESVLTEEGIVRVSAGDLTDGMAHLKFSEKVVSYSILYCSDPAGTVKGGRGYPGSFNDVPYGIFDVQPGSCYYVVDVVYENGECEYGFIISDVPDISVLEKKLTKSLANCRESLLNSQNGWKELIRRADTPEGLDQYIAALSTAGDPLYMDADWTQYHYLIGDRNNRFGKNGGNYFDDNVLLIARLKGDGKNNPYRLVSVGSYGNYVNVYFETNANPTEKTYYPGQGPTVWTYFVAVNRSAIPDTDDIRLYVDGVRAA